jgi:hypothetical protein
MWRTTRRVLLIPSYATVGVLATAASLTAFVLSQNIGAMWTLLVASSLSISARATILLEQYPLVGPAYGHLASALLFLTAVLVGVDVALLTYHLRKHRVSLGHGSSSVMGVALGTLGAGCAACGSAILAGVLSLLGLSGLLAVLPLDGLEMAIVAIGVLVLSIYWLADGMRGGAIRGCPIEQP